MKIKWITAVMGGEKYEEAVDDNGMKKINGPYATRKEAEEFAKSARRTYAKVYIVRDRGIYGHDFIVWICDLAGPGEPGSVYPSTDAGVQGIDLD